MPRQIFCVGSASCRREALAALGVLAMLGLTTPVLAGPPLVPPQLVAACAKLPVGAPCTVTFQDKVLTGVCQALPDHSHACLPAKAGRAGKPPRSKDSR